MKWIAYGLDIDNVIFETDESNIDDAVAYCKGNSIDFDTIEPYDNVFINRARGKDAYQTDDD